MTKKHLLLVIFSFVSSLIYGQFAEPLNIAAGVQWASDTELHDFDNDGDLDIISILRSQGKIAYHENLGNGEFKCMQVIVDPPGLSDVMEDCVIADKDSDGDMDIIVAQPGNYGIFWLENLGNGQFGNYDTIVQGFSYQSIVKLASADVDNDGDIDLVSIDNSSGALYWYENFGSGNFGPSNTAGTVIGFLQNPMSVDIADMDGDLDLDIVTGNQFNIYSFENLGNAASWGTGTLISSSINQAVEVVLKDLDGDLDLDLISCEKGAGNINYHENLGSGVFAAKTTISSGQLAVSDIYVTDMDNDSDMDIVSSIQGLDQIKLFENLGSLSFSSLIIDNSIDGPTTINCADINGSGFQDVIACRIGAPDLIFTYKNLSALSFGPMVRLVSNLEDIKDIEIGDIDMDGHNDILGVSQGDGKLVWYPSLGNGQFDQQIIIDQNQFGSFKAELIDIDLDNDLDIVAIVTDGSSIEQLEWYENDGSGNFNPSQNLISGIGMNDFAVGDADGDGDYDVFVFYEYSPNIHTVWIENTGSGFGGFHQIENAPGYWKVLYCQDFDSDGDVDLIVMNNGEIAWFENDGTGQFAGKISISTSVSNTRDFQIGDINSDGLKDIVCAQINSVVWYERTGSTSFGTEQILTDSLTANFIALIDIEMDSDTDILLAESSLSSTSGLYLMENQGAGIFSNEIIFNNQLGTSRILVEDVDEDGDQDILFSTVLNHITLIDNLSSIQPPVSVEEFEKSVSIYPNPTEGDFYIISDSDYSYVIYNSLGILIQKGTGYGNLLENCSLAKSGIYFLELSTNTRTESFKIVKN